MNCKRGSLRMCKRGWASLRAVDKPAGQRLVQADFANGGTPECANGGTPVCSAPAAAGHVPLAICVAARHASPRVDMSIGASSVPFGQNVHAELAPTDMGHTAHGALCQKRHIGCEERRRKPRPLRQKPGRPRLQTGVCQNAQTGVGQFAGRRQTSRSEACPCRFCKQGWPRMRKRGHRCLQRPGSSRARSPCDLRCCAPRQSTRRHVHWG